MALFVPRGLDFFKGGGGESKKVTKMAVHAGVFDFVRALLGK